MVGHGGSSAGSYLADPTSPITSHCAVILLFKSPSASIAVTSTSRISTAMDSFKAKNPCYQAAITAAMTQMKVQHVLCCTSNKTLRIEG